ncbi:MAG: dTDP-glucose 4,6-dehydratase [Planctomycetota bacterium]|jgi:dTDP-glucose 4,6-dehydratase
MTDYRKIFVTGGCGFIGSNFIHYILAQRPDVEIVNFDKLTYAGNLENLAGVEKDARYSFVKGDIADRGAVEATLTADIDAVVNFAAETHVDRSILDAGDFIRTNVLGTQVLLEVARARGVERFIQISTDEVYGSLGPTGYFTEETPLAPNSPYSASKASGDLIGRSYFHTFGFPVIVTRCSNNFGPYQFPEKLIPLFVTNALADEVLPLYGDGMNVRDWIYVDDHSSAILAVLEKGEPGEVYNIGGGNERANVDITKTILSILGKPESLITFVKDRPGHDRRYAIDSTKVESALGWAPEHSFEEAIERTVKWYVDNPTWWQHVKSGEYMEYYRKQYGGR